MSENDAQKAWLEGSGEKIKYQDFKMDKPYQWEENGLTVTRTRAWTAPGCHEGCGVLVYADKDGKFVKIEGDPDYPFNQGRLCPRCLAIDELMYHPDRIIYPMKRAVEKRGDADAWERCTWDEALNLAYEHFVDVSNKYGAETIYFMRGTGRDIIWQVGRLASTVGSPNECSPLSGISCYVPRLSQMIMTCGGQLTADFSANWPDRFDADEYELPNCCILWGSNLFNSNAEFQLCGWITDMKKRGTKIITVDPRITWIAAHSYQHLQIRPGTDGALALAMSHVVVEEDLYDHEFVEKWVYGFDEVKEMLQEWTPEKAAETCWITPEEIRQAARTFAEKKPSNVLWGVSVDMQKSGVSTAMAIEVLFIITGNVDIPGGMMFTAFPGGVNQEMSGGWGLYDLLSEEQQAKRIGLDKYPMYRFGFTFCSPDEALIAAEQGALKALWIQSSNTLACTGQEPDRWYEVMKNVEYGVCCDLFMTPTAQACSDLFLPVSCWPERVALRAHYFDLATINPAVKPAGEVKSDTEICRLFGRMFNKDAWPWETEEEVFDHILKPSGFTYKQLQEHGPAYPEYTYHKAERGELRPDGKPGFMTPTGRLEIFSTNFNQFGLSPMAKFSEPGMSPVSSPELYERCPFILMTGARNGVFFHSEFRQVERMRQFNPDPYTQINPEDAARLGIEDGDWVWLENDYGKVRQRAQVTEEVAKGTVLCQHGWWFPEQDGSEPNLYGVWTVNPSRLVPNAPSETGFGSDIKCVLCNVYKVAEGDL